MSSLSQLSQIYPHSLSAVVQADQQATCERESLANRAYVCFAAAQFDQAIILSQQALQSLMQAPEVSHEGQLTKILFCVAASHYEKREFSKAIQIFRKICGSNPDNEALSTHLNKVEQKRSHLLHQPIAMIDPTDPLQKLMTKIFNQRNKVSIFPRDLNEKIPNFSEELNLYRHSLYTQRLPLNLSVNPIEGIGEGIFLKTSAKEITPRRFIGFYAGRYQLAPNSHWKPSSYVWGLNTQGFRLDKKEQELYALATGQSPEDALYYLDINALEEGNFTRFINHSSTDFNCEGLLVVVEDQTIQVAIFSTQKINPGEQLLLNYSVSYWQGIGEAPKPLTPKMFQLDQNGKIWALEPST